LDFYCGRVKLAVELDGAQHFEADGIEYDNIRTVYLAAWEIQIIRFTNADVDENFEGVCNAIDMKVKALMK